MTQLGEWGGKNLRCSALGEWRKKIGTIGWKKGKKPQKPTKEKVSKEDFEGDVMGGFRGKVKGKVWERETKGERKKQSVFTGQY